jgi:hypothetical protein
LVTGSVHKLSGSARGSVSDEKVECSCHAQINLWNIQGDAGTAHDVYERLHECRLSTSRSLRTSHIWSAVSDRHGPPPTFQLSGKASRHNVRMWDSKILTATDSSTERAL